MYKEVIEHVLQVVSATLCYLAARYLLDISTPQRDYQELLSMEVFNIDARWYRGPEYFHQLKAKKVYYHDNGGSAIDRSGRATDIE